MKKYLVLVVLLIFILGCGGKSPGNGTDLDPGGANGDDPTPSGEYCTVTVGAGEPVAVVELYIGDSLRQTAAVITKQGKFTVPPERYYAISRFIDNKAIAMCDPNGTWQYEYHVIDKNGNVLNKIDSSIFGNDYMNNKSILARYYSEGIVAFMQGNLFGFVNINGQVIASAQYEEIKPFSNGLAAVKKGVAWEFIDTQDHVVFSLGDFSGCDSFYDGLAYYFDNDGFGYRDKTGTVIISYRYSSDWPSPKRYGFCARYGSFSEGIAPAEVERWVGDTQFQELGIMDKEGRVLFRQEESDACKRWKVVGHHLDGNRFINGLLPVCTSDAFSWTGYGFLDINGKLTIPMQTQWRPVGYCYAYETTIENLDGYCAFHEDLCAVQEFGSNDGKIGFIDNTGYVQIDYQYDAVRQFANGLAAVGVENGSNWQWIYIDKNGDTVIGSLRGKNNESLTLSNAFNFE